MSENLLRPFTLRRHYTHFGAYGRYEVMRKGRVYKHSYIYKTDGGEIEQIEDQIEEAYNMFEDRVEGHGRGYQMEANFEYEVDGVKHIHTKKTCFNETPEEAFYEMEIEAENTSKKFIVSGIKTFIRGEYLLNIIW